MAIKSTAPASNNTIAQRYDSLTYNNTGVLSVFSADLRKIIINFAADEIISVVVQKAVFSGNDIKDAHAKLVSFCQVSLEFNAFSQKQLTEIKTIYMLFNKYSAHNRQYLEPGCGWKLDEAKRMVPCGNPQLLDLFSCGVKLSDARYSFEKFGADQENDMKTILKLMPKSLLCNIGSLYCREFITPFIMACINPNVSVEIIEFLLQNGAEPNSIYCHNTQKRHILTDLGEDYPKRYEQLLPTLTKYGAVEVTFTYKDLYLYPSIEDSEKKTTTPEPSNQ